MIMMGKRKRVMEYVKNIIATHRSRSLLHSELPLMTLNFLIASCNSLVKDSYALLL